MLLIDDKEGEEALLSRYWDASRARVLHTRDLADFETMAAGGRPEGWPEPPYDVVAAVIDLDLGHQGPGPAGGIVATHRISSWARDNRLSLPIVLRTEDVDDDRSLAAVLAAELLEAPIPLWGKSAEEAGQLLEFIAASRDGIVEPAAYGGHSVHPVRFIREERGEQLLGDYLYDGQRAEVWDRLAEGFDLQTAVLAIGVKKHNRFWDHLNSLFAALLHMRDTGSPLHLLAGRTLRLRDVEREIALAVKQNIELAQQAVRTAPDLSEVARRDVIKLLEDDRQAYVAWLEGHAARPPYQNRNNDQGDFWGTFGRVLGHPDVVDLFRH